MLHNNSSTCSSGTPNCKGGRVRLDYLNHSSIILYESLTFTAHFNKLIFKISSSFSANKTTTFTSWEQYKSVLKMTFYAVTWNKLEPGKYFYKMHLTSRNISHVKKKFYIACKFGLVFEEIKISCFNSACWTW